ncbi:hypothetical protein Tco_1436322 [Tanacetum coccineum]
MSQFNHNTGDVVKFGIGTKNDSGVASKPCTKFSLPWLLMLETNCWESWEWHERWQEFQKLDQGKHALCHITSETVNTIKTKIQLDHPIVSAIGNYAINAFNDLCKEEKSNNLCDHQVMNCMYLKFSKLYCFYMTIEVIEEGIIGVYEATIACDPVDDRGSLVKFILTDQKPTGMKENLEIKLGTLLSIEEIQFNMSKRLKFKYATSSTTTWKKLSYDNHGESESDGIKSG